MALIGSHPAPARTLSIAAAVARAKSWLANKSDSGLAQRIAGTAFLIRVASAGLAFIAQIVLARWMGQFEYGIYVYVWTWVLLLGTLAPLGVAYSAQRFIPHYAVMKDYDGLRGFLRALGWICLGLGTLVAGASTLGIVTLDIVPRHYLVPFLIGLGCVPIFALSSAQDATARAKNWINLALFPVYVAQPLFIIAAVLLVHFAGRQVTAETALTIAVGGFWIMVLAQFAMLQVRLSRVVERGPRRYEFALWLRTSLPNFLVDGFFFLLTSIDLLLLQIFVGPEQIAVYFAASKILALVAFVYFAVSAACAHRFSEYHAAGDRKKLADFAAASARWTFWPSLIFAAVLLALGIPFLKLFGSGFEAGYPLMLVLAVGLLARASVGPAERLLTMTGEQRYSAMIYATALAVSVVLCLALAPFLGAMGAAIGTAAAIGVESLLLYVMVKRRLGLHVFAFGRKAD